MIWTGERKRESSVPPVIPKKVRNPCLTQNSGVKLRFVAAFGMTIGTDYSFTEIPRAFIFR